jgi:hypothetical protein
MMAGARRERTLGDLLDRRRLPLAFGRTDLTPDSRQARTGAALVAPRRPRARLKYARAGPAGAAIVPYDPSEASDRPPTFGVPNLKARLTSRRIAFTRRLSGKRSSASRAPMVRRLWLTAGAKESNARLCAYVGTSVTVSLRSRPTADHA